MLAQSTPLLDALDDETETLVKQLSDTWGVAPPEALRCALRLAVAADKPALPTPAEVVRRYRNGAVPRNAAETARLIAAQRAAREADDLQRTTWPE